MIKSDHPHIIQHKPILYFIYGIYLTQNKINKTIYYSYTTNAHRY